MRSARTSECSSDIVFQAPGRGFGSNWSLDGCGSRRIRFGMPVLRQFGAPPYDAMYRESVRTLRLDEVRTAGKITNPAC